MNITKSEPEVPNELYEKSQDSASERNNFSSGGDIGGQYRYSRALTGEELRPPLVGEVCWI